MTEEPDELRDMAPSVEAVEQALAELRAGSTGAFDALINADEGESLSVCDWLGKLLSPHPRDLGVPAQIGDYAITGLVGRGGMAVVYEATQLRSGQRVALKVIRRWGLTGDQYVRLFEREVATLSRLKHPGVAALYDAGHTSDGFHYFAMERAEGRPLSHDLVQTALGSATTPDGLTARLKVFRLICDAMNYAHQRGVVHCDLKPTNILVDDEGRAKVLDFGLAQLLDVDGGLASGVSELARIQGTLCYMSPEQARGAIEEVDTRADVYALGVILFELLTGRRPYDAAATSLPGAIRSICEDTPPRPSTLNPLLRGDLDTIVLKALEKDPQQRYQSAAALSEDIRRFVNHEPILARPPSLGYELRKLVQRHRWTSALTVTLALTVTAFAVILAVQATRLAKERDGARRAARDSRQTFDYLNNMLASVDPHRIGANVSIKDLLDHAASELQAEFADQPAMRASLHNTLGQGYIALQLHEQAQHHLGEALRLRRELFGELSLEYAESLHQFGVMESTFKFTEKAGLQSLTRAYEIRCKLLGENSLDTADSLTSLARIEIHTANHRRAERRMRQALAIQREALGDHPRVARTLCEIGTLLVVEGRCNEAEPLLQQALEMQRRLLGDDHFDVAVTLGQLVTVYSSRNDFNAVATTCEEQIRILRRIYGNEGSIPLAHAISDLAGLMEQVGRLNEAEVLFVESVEMESHCAGADHATLTSNNYGAFLRYQARYAEAERYARAVYQQWGTPTNLNAGVPYARQNLAAVLLELGAYQEAEHYYRDADRAWLELFGADHPRRCDGLIGLGRLALIRGEPDVARAFFRNVMTLSQTDRAVGIEVSTTARIYLAMCDEALGVDVPDTGFATVIADLQAAGITQSRTLIWTLNQLAGIEIRSGKLASAQQHFEQALALDDALGRSRHPDRADALAGIGELAMLREDYTAAKTWLAGAVEIYMERCFATQPQRIHAETQLGQCLGMLGKTDDARAMLSSVVQRLTHATTTTPRPESPAASDAQSNDQTAALANAYDQKSRVAAIAEANMALQGLDAAPSHGTTVPQE